MRKTINKYQKNLPARHSAGLRATFSGPLHSKCWCGNMLAQQRLAGHHWQATVTQENGAGALAGWGVKPSAAPESPAGRVGGKIAAGHSRAKGAWQVWNAAGVQQGQGALAAKSESGEEAARREPGVAGALEPLQSADLAEGWAGRKRKLLAAPCHAPHAWRPPPADPLSVRHAAEQQRVAQGRASLAGHIPRRQQRAWVCLQLHHPVCDCSKQNCLDDYVGQLNRGLGQGEGQVAVHACRCTGQTWSPSSCR